MSGLAAAHELSRTPALRARYEVTVYEMASRLGGELASRNVPRRGSQTSPPPLGGHGRHVWFGFYENTFRLVREVYESWDGPPDRPFDSMWDFLRPQRHLLVEHEVDGASRAIGVRFPRAMETPDDGRVLEGFLELVADVIDAARTSAGLGPSDGGRASTARSRFREPVASWPRASDVSAAHIETLHRRVDLLGRFVSSRFGAMPGDVRAQLAEHTHRLLATTHPKIARALERLAREDPARRLFHSFVDATLAFLRGLTNPRDGVYLDGDLDRVSDRDFRSWLVDNGCSADAAENCPWIVAVYQASSVGSASARPSLAAGTAARHLIRGNFLYRHAPAYLVEAGMSEAVVTPLGEVLRSRGVRFRLSHRLARMQLAPGRRNLARLHFVDEVRARRSTSRAPGDRFLVLAAGTDFDTAIIALPRDAIHADRAGASPCAEWLAAAPAVRDATAPTPAPHGRPARARDAVTDPRSRLAAHQSGLGNVALAGTWTKTSVATASIESAVMSGVAAARAVGVEGRVILGEAFMSEPAPIVRIAACASRLAASRLAEARSP